MLIFAHQDPNSQVPSFASILALLGPLLGIAFGFDAINGERSERTLPRLVAQPIHRDAVIIGKFAAGLAVIGVVLLAITLLVSGVAFLVLGISVGPDEIGRLVAWFLVALAYLGFWLAFALLCSVVVRRAATSLFAAIALWIVLTIFAQLLVGIVADYVAPLPAERDERPADRQCPAPDRPRPDLARHALRRGLASTCSTRRSRPSGSCRPTRPPTSGRFRRSWPSIRACCWPGRRSWRSSP